MNASAMLIRFLAVCIGGSLLLLGGGPVWAQSDEVISVTASATPSEVGTAGTVTFHLRVRGVPLSAIETPEPPSTTNLALQNATPVTQRQLSFDSGQLQRRITFKWRYKPMRVGIGRLKPVAVRIRQETYETDEVRVRIVDQGKRDQRSRRAQSRQGRSTDADDGGAPPAGAVPSENGAESGSDEAPRDVFIRATASPDTAYQNQQVTTEYRLFFRPHVRLRRSHMADAWDAPGFWREELDVETRPLPETERLYGRTYKSIVLKRVALFPTRPGRLRVDPLQIETEARVMLREDKRTSRHSGTYFEPTSLSSDALVIQSKSLPDGRPEAFDGAVGDFSLGVTVDRDSVAVGTGIEVIARIRGQGNLPTVSPPSLEVPSAFAKYEPAVETHIERSDSTIRGEKAFTYTIVPEKNGDYRIPPVRFAYFDPEHEQYEQLSSKSAPLQVTGEASARAVGEMGDGLPIGDIAGPMEAATHWKRTARTPLYAQPWAYAALLGPLVLAVGAVAYRRRRRDQMDEEEGEAEAPKRVQQHLQDVKAHLHDDDGEVFYQTLEQTLLRFLEQRLDLPRPAPRMTADAFDRVLQDREVSSVVRTALCELLDTCKEAQFGPSAPAPEARSAILKQAQALLPRLDDALARTKQDAAT